MKTIYFITAKVFDADKDQFDTAKIKILGESQEFAKRHAIAEIVRAKLPKFVSVEISEIESIPDYMIYECMFDRVSPKGERAELAMERINDNIQITVKGKQQHREAFDMLNGARVEIRVDEV